MKEIGYRSMEYTKVQQQMNDIVGDNVKKLAQLFPAAVKDGEVDFEALKEELGQFQEVGSEKYELTWAGKKNAKKIAQEDVVGRTLKFIPEDSKDAETTENLYIEGDNLEVLKLLRQNYYGAVKMIYIDPPYNTGNDFVYNDSFEMNNDEIKENDESFSGFGEKYSINSDTQSRYHANWISMMYPRLKVAKDLLRDDGVIFISIDDNEMINLKGICNEIFGEENFIEQLIWKRRANTPNDRVIGKIHEYILVYAKNMDSVVLYLQPRDAALDEKYKNPNNDSRGPWFADNLSANGKGGRLVQSCVYPIKNPITGEEYYPPQNKCWLYNREKMNELMVDGRIGFRESSGAPYLKRFLSEVRQGSTLPTLLLDKGFSVDSAKEIRNLFGKDVFEFPKPTILLKTLIRTGSYENDIVLDFFSGSCSTVQALFEINIEMKINRKFIMVQLPELCKDNSEAQRLGYQYICQVAIERIKKAGQKIKSEHPDADIDIGFKVFRTADTNIKWNSLMDLGQVNMSQLEYTPDLIDFMPGAKDVDIVYELMLRQRDVALSETLEQLSDIGSRTYLYASSYLVCLETEITEELVSKLAELDPLPIKFIFRDSAFKDDIALKDETFRRLKALIEKNAGTNKPAYTVEFI